MPTISPQPPVAAQPLAAAPAALPDGAVKDGVWQSADGFSFGDLVDILNPLQHLPIVGMVYREITGDNIGAGAKLLGGTLFGGIPGFVTSMLDATVEKVTGQDTGKHMIALLRSGERARDEDDFGGTLVARTAELEPFGEDERTEIAAFLDRSAARDAPDDAANIATAGYDDSIDDGPQSHAASPARDAAAAQPQAVPRETANPRPLRQSHRAGLQVQANNASQPQPLQSTVNLNGVRGAAFTGLPSPATVAANPGLVAAARGGGKVAAGSSAAWARLVEAADHGTTGAGGGLATGTIAKAMSSYGAADMSRLPIAATAGRK